MTRRLARWAAGLCLVLPVVALLAVPTYARSEPRVLGLPFFYAYQLGWVVAVVVLLALADRLRRAGERRGGAR